MVIRHPRAKASPLSLEERRRVRAKRGPMTGSARLEGATAPLSQRGLHPPFGALNHRHQPAAVTLELAGEFELEQHRADDGG